MTTYKGLPGPHICDFWSRETSLEYFRAGGILDYVLRKLAA